MSKPQAALADVGPMERQVEVDARLCAMKPHVLLDRAFGCADPRESMCVTAVVPQPCFAGFQISDLVLTRRFEHAIARVPVGLHVDVVEMPMRQTAQRRLCRTGKAKVRYCKTAPAIQPG